MFPGPRYARWGWCGGGSVVLHLLTSEERHMHHVPRSLAPSLAPCLLPSLLTTTTYQLPHPPCSHQPVLPLAVQLPSQIPPTAASPHLTPTPVQRPISAQPRHLCATPSSLRAPPRRSDRAAVRGSTTQSAAAQRTRGAARMRKGEASVVLRAGGPGGVAGSPSTRAQRPGGCFHA
ncbi:hypothetical protein P171DRAFT_19211 [Karstenula rhodostoma CBS 690.94]|uniref:Uncharacterized protein n=1 Tax=Karstenula rhodostoma CBS 690.94 TaxID=1392251 RepID=A0A9P4UK88_9PLEO|nr:hypothetical protein P171DRAFT_19211 [Karstenula rhodostoma CBS 690.94]